MPNGILVDGNDVYIGSTQPESDSKEFYGRLHVVKNASMNAVARQIAGEYNYDISSHTFIPMLNPSDGYVKSPGVVLGDVASVSFHKKNALVFVSTDQLFIFNVSNQLMRALNPPFRHSDAPSVCLNNSHSKYMLDNTLFWFANLYGVIYDPVKDIIYAATLFGNPPVDYSNANKNWNFTNNGTQGCILAIDEKNNQFWKLPTDNWAAAGMMSNLWQMDIDDAGNLYVPSSPTWDGLHAQLAGGPDPYRSNSSVFRINTTTGFATLVQTGFHEPWGVRLWPRNASDPRLGSSINTHVFVANTKDHTIKVILPNSTVAHVVGAGMEGNPDELIQEGYNSNFTCVAQLDFSVDASGNIVDIYTTTEHTGQLLRISYGPPPDMSPDRLPSFTHIVETYDPLGEARLHAPNGILYNHATGDLYVGNTEAAGTEQLVVVRKNGVIESVVKPQNITHIYFAQPSDGVVPAENVLPNDWMSLAYYNATHILAVSYDQILLVATAAPATILALTAKHAATTMDCSSDANTTFDARNTSISLYSLYGITRNPTSRVIYVSSMVGAYQGVYDNGTVVLNDGTLGCIIMLDEVTNTLRKLNTSTWAAAGMMAHLWQMDIDEEGSLYVPSSPTFDGTHVDNFNDVPFARKSSVFKVNGTSGRATLVATGFHEPWGLRLWPRSLTNPYVGSARDTHVFVANTKNHTIDVILPNGTVRFVAGAGKAGNPDDEIAEGFNSNFTCIPQIDFSMDAHGNILDFYVAPEAEAKILRISR
jgi:uncharacterized membrane protein